MTVQEISSVLDNLKYLGLRYKKLKKDLDSDKLDQFNIQQEINLIHKKINSINKALDILTEVERNIIVSTHGDKKYIKELEKSKTIPYKRTKIYEIRKKALHKMSDFLCTQEEHN